MADTFTTNLNLTKPEVGASTDTWGTKINADLDAVDAIFAATGTAVNVKFASANFDDSAKAIFGTGDDLEIFHDGSDSYINSNGADLRLKADDVKIYNYAGTEVKAIFTTDGSVDLYHNNVKKFETSSTGATVTGTLVSGGIQSSIAGNTTTGGNIQLGITTDDAAKYTAITAQQHDSGTETEGFTLIGGNSAAADTNLVNIGGGFGEQNPATALRFFTGSAATREGVLRATIDSSGNVGVGTASAFGTASDRTVLSVNGTSSATVNIGTGGTQQLFMFTNGSYGRLSTLDSLPLTFGVNDSEKIRIDTAGKTIVKPSGSGDSVQFFVETQNSSDTGIAFGRNGTNNLKTSMRSASAGSSSAMFMKLALGESEGTISNSSPQFTFYYNGNLTATGSVSSDRRLKENIVDIPDGSTALIKSLNPVSFNLIGSPVHKAGFIAQEVETVKSSLVNGGEEDEEGNETIRGVDYYGILAHAVKTIQELEARIETLENA